MSVFFKLGEDGKKVYVAKTLFTKEMREDEFEKKAKLISVDEFLNKFSKEVSEKLQKAILRVQKIEEMKLSEFSIMHVSHPVKRTTRTRYVVGNKVFCSDSGEEEELDQRQEAYDYAKEFYGETFANDTIIPLMEKGRVVKKAYSENKEIELAKYNELINEKNALTSINSIEKLLNKSNKR